MNPQTYTAPQEQQEAPASFAAILPLLLFLLIFIGTGVSLSLAGVDMAFYQLSATVAILPACPKRSPSSSPVWARSTSSPCA